VTFDLLRCGVISGNVLGIAFGGGLEELRVVAFPWGRPPSCDDIERRRDNDYLLRWSSVSMDGSFVIDGLKLGVGYDVYAGGNKQLSSRLENPAVPDAHWVALHLSSLLGVRIEVADEQDAPMMVNPHLFLEGVVTFHGPQDIPPNEWLLDWEAALSRIPGMECGVIERMGFPLTVVVRNPNNAARWGPISVLIGRPGYGTARKFAYATRIDDGIPESVIPLARKADCWSTVSLSFSHEPWSELFDTSLTDWGVLTLVTSSGEEYALRIGALVPSSYSGIPCGDYMTSFSSCRLFWYPDRGTSMPLRVDDGGATIDLDLAGAGALVVNLVDSEGRDVSERVTLRVQREDGSLASASFSRPPYGIPAMSAGLYTLGAYIDAWVPPGKEPYRTSIEIRSGETAAVILSPSN